MSRASEVLGKIYEATFPPIYHEPRHLPTGAKHLDPQRVQKLHPSDTLAWVPTAEVEKRWQHSEQYIGPGGSSHEQTSPAKYRGASTALSDTSKPIRAPRVEFNEHGEIGFVDGRHHYAAMRDAGHTHVPVAVTEESMRVLSPPRPKLRGFSRAARQARAKQRAEMRKRS